MTTLAVAPTQVLRPVPWPRLAWVAWRRYRSTLAVTVGVLVLVSVYLVIDGTRMRSAYSAVGGCRPAHSLHCQYLSDNFQNIHDSFGIVWVFLLLLPGVIGSFAGAPVLAREFETGTFRYAWTQGVGRMRWAVAAIVPGAVGVAVITGGFGALVYWYNQPLVDAGIKPRLQPATFPATGIAAAAWGLAGFALGMLAGLLWRHVLAGLATAAAVWFGLAYLTAMVLRPHYLSPLTTTNMQLSGRDLTIGTWWTKGGVRVGDAQINSVLQTLGVQVSGGGGKIAVVGPGGPLGTAPDPFQYLRAHGYVQVTSYQPASRYWPFQWIEFGWLAALAVLLLAATLWLLRRRPA